METYYLTSLWEISLDNAIDANTCTNLLVKERMPTQNLMDTQVGEQQQQMLLSIRPEGSEH